MTDQGKLDLESFSLSCFASQNFFNTYSVKVKGKHRERVRRAMYWFHMLKSLVSYFKGRRGGLHFALKLIPITRALQSKTSRRKVRFLHIFQSSHLYRKRENSMVYFRTQRMQFNILCLNTFQVTRRRHLMSQNLTIKQFSFWKLPWRIEKAQYK